MKKIVAVVLAVLFVLAGSGCGETTKFSTDVDAVEYSDSVQNFAEDVKAGNYLDAIDTYNSSIYGNAVEENDVSLFLQEYLFENIQLFNQGAISENEYSDVLISVQKVDDSLGIITFALTDAQEEFNTLVNSKSIYKDGLNYMEVEDFLSAADCFSRVSSLDVNYETAQLNYSDAIEKYTQQIIASAEEKIANEDYSTAIFIIENAAAYTGYLDKYNSILITAHTLNAESFIREALEIDDYPSAKLYYENYLNDSYVTFSADIVTLLAEAETNYRNSIKESVQLAVDSGDYAGALKTIENGLITFENDESRLQLQTDVQEGYDDYLLRTTPVNLIDLNPYKEDDGGLYASDSPTTDIMGHEYRTNIHKSISGSETYRIDGIYKQFTGSLFVDTTKDDHPWSVSFYGDGICIYDTTVTGGTDSISFDVDISGVNDLQIIVKGGYGYLRTLYIGDPVLTP